MNLFVLSCIIYFLSFSYLLSFPLQFCKSTSFSTSLQIIFFQDVHNLAVNCLDNSNSWCGKSSVIYNNFEFREEQKQKVAKLFSDVPPELDSFRTQVKIPPEELIQKAFLNKSIFFFGPFIPWFLLYQQLFTSTQIIQRRLKIMLQNVHPTSLNIMYLNSDFGLDSFLTNQPPPKLSNFLVLSAGGSGHISIPCIFYEYENFVPAVKSKHKFVFIGTFHKWRRNCVNWFLKYQLSNIFLGKSKYWLELFPFSDMVLDLRGRGRNTARFSETIQLGMIPFYLHDSFLALPYFNSSIDFERFIYFGHMDQLNLSLPAFQIISNQQLSFQKSVIRKIAPVYYKRDGLNDQIQRFMLTGYEDSDLRCQKVVSSFPIF